MSATAGLVAAAVVGGMLLAPSTAVAEPGACEDFFVLGARGSGEAQDDVGGLGSTTIGPFVDQLVAGLPSSVSVGISAVNYPAVSIPDLAVDGLDATQTYDASVVDGGTNADNILDEQVAACPNQKFILAGYSQGADVIGNLIERRPDLYSRIAWVALFGDPRYDGATTSAAGAWRGTGGQGRGISGIARGVPGPLVGRFTSACMASDVVCLGFAPGNGTEAHFTYVSSGVAGAIADEVARGVIAGPPAPVLEVTAEIPAPAPEPAPVRAFDYWAFQTELGASNPPSGQWTTADAARMSDSNALAKVYLLLPQYGSQCTFDPYSLYVRRTCDALVPQWAAVIRNDSIRLSTQAEIVRTMNACKAEEAGNACENPAVQRDSEYGQEPLPPLPDPPAADYGSDAKLNEMVEIMNRPASGGGFNPLGLLVPILLLPLVGPVAVLTG